MAAPSETTGPEAREALPEVEESVVKADFATDVRARVDAATADDAEVADPGDSVDKVVDAEWPRYRERLVRMAQLRARVDANERVLDTTLSNSGFLGVMSFVLVLAGGFAALAKFVHPSWIGLGAIGVLVFGSFVGIVMRPRTLRNRSTAEAVLARDKQELADQQSRFERLVEPGVVQPILAALAPTTTLDPAQDRIRYSPPGSKATRQQFCSNAGALAVASALDRDGGAAVALSGSRGAGKTTIARNFTRDALPTGRGDRQDPIGVFMAAPVDYDIPLFLLAVLKEVCLRSLGPDYLQEKREWLIGRVRRFRLAIALAVGLLTAAIGALFLARWLERVDYTASPLFWAILLLSGIVVVVGLALFVRGSLSLVWFYRERPEEELLRRIEFAETTTDGTTVSAGWQGIGMSRARSVQLQRRPISDVDVPRELELLGRQLQRPIVIAIDELDKMKSDKQAIRFVNRIKPLFQADGCSFMVSVSESAWARFEQRGLPGRDAFDSAFDEIIHIDYLTPEQSVQMLRARAPNVSILQALVSHSLSGGLPRELLRAARGLAAAAHSTGDDALLRVLDEVIRLDLLERSRSAAVVLTSRQSDVDHAAQVILDDVARQCEAATAGDLPALLQQLSKLEAPAADSDEKIDGSGQVPGPRMVRSIACLALILETLRDALTIGDASQLPRKDPLQSDAVTMGFLALGAARRELERSPESARSALIQARHDLHLPVIEPDDCDSSGSSGTDRSSASQDARRSIMDESVDQNGDHLQVADAADCGQGASPHGEQPDHAWAEETELPTVD